MSIRIDPTSFSSASLFGNTPTTLNLRFSSLLIRSIDVRGSDLFSMFFLESNVTHKHREKLLGSYWLLSGISLGVQVIGEVLKDNLRQTLRAPRLCFSFLQILVRIVANSNSQKFRYVTAK